MHMATSTRKMITRYGNTIDITVPTPAGAGRLGFIAQRLPSTNCYDSARVVPAPTTEGTIGAPRNPVRPGCPSLVDHDGRSGNHDRRSGDHDRSGGDQHGSGGANPHLCLGWPRYEEQGCRPQR